jgi:2-hydroxychromene-2-carboxylate isomerase
VPRRDTPPPATSIPAAFYFDLASPIAYLAAERVLHVLPGPAEWRPVLAGGLAGAKAQLPARSPGQRDRLRAEVERRARELDLQPLRWPEPFPFDSSLAMRVATYASSIGRAVPFAQAAFRQAFAGGHSLEDPAFVLIAAAACEMHPAAVLRGAELGSVWRRLSGRAAVAVELGVTEVPAVVIGGEVFVGEGALERAAERMRVQGSRQPVDGRAGARSG